MERYWRRDSCSALSASTASRRSRGVLASPDRFISTFTLHVTGFSTAKKEHTYFFSLETCMSSVHLVFCQHYFMHKVLVHVSNLLQSVLSYGTLVIEYKESLAFMNNTYKTRNPRGA